MVDERERKRQRLSSFENPLVMDVNSPAKWDFLAPWCDELQGQLVSLSNGYIRVLGPRAKREKPLRFNYWELSDDEEEENKKDPEKEAQEIEKAFTKTREAIELLSLVASVDKKAFHMLMTQQCKLRLDDEESDEEEEEFRLVVNGEEPDFIMSGDEDSGEDGEEEDSEEEEEEGENSGEEEENDNVGDETVCDINDADEDEEEEDDDDVLVIPPDTSKADRRHKRENFISPRFDFILMRGIPGEELPASAVEIGEKICLSDAPPSDEYEQAKTRILEMRTDARSNQRLLEIPVSLDFGNWAKTAEELAGNLQQLITFVKTTKLHNQKREKKALEVKCCTNVCVYRIAELSLLLSNNNIITNLLAERVLQVLETGVPSGEFHFYLKDGNDDTEKVASHAALGKLFSGMLLSPLCTQNLSFPSFRKLIIACEDSALWQFEALCSALATSRAPITKLELTDACVYRKKGPVRGKFWKLLTRTLFHTRSCSSGPFSSVRGLSLGDVKLTMDDLDEITAVLRHKEQQEAIAQQWDICKKSWALRENTILQFTEEDGDERVFLTGDSFELPVKTPVEVVESNSDEIDDETGLDVIVPGYGQCRVSRDSIIAVPSKKQIEGEPLTSLSLSFKTNADGVTGLLKEIGWSLQKLSLSFHREIDVNSMIPSILSSCPSVTKLSLCESFIDLDRFSTAYESESETSPTIVSLDFQDLYDIGENHGKLFMKRLGDPSTRMGKHLRELTIYTEEYGEPIDDPTLSELWMAMGTNVTLEKLDIMVSRTMWAAIWKRRLRQFHGQLLPPRSLPFDCKLAFLSVTRAPNDKICISAIQQLDQGVLSLIFDFAATRVVRTVLVHG